MRRGLRSWVTDKRFCSDDWYPEVTGFKGYSVKLIWKPPAVPSSSFDYYCVFDGNICVDRWKYISVNLE